jgi:carboxypeptidase C (cathepsin A)
MLGLFNEVGPCMTVQDGLDAITTIPREYSWDRASNMLFFDQVRYLAVAFILQRLG